MRKIVAIVTLLASSACGTSGQWQKPGTDQASVEKDLLQCRREATQEMMRLFADWRPFAIDNEPYWNWRSEPQRHAVRRSNELSQAQAEQTLSVTCMRNKGYTIASA